MNIYDYNDYRTYISKRLNDDKEKVLSRGGMAEYLNVNPSFISQVLTGKSDFSLEHAIQIDKYLLHTAQETEFFLLLVQKARAGSVVLQEYFDSKINQIVQARSQISNRVKTASFYDDADIAKYFESWIPMAIQVALSIHRFKSYSSLAKGLGISERQVKEVINFLIDKGMCSPESLDVNIQGKQIHFGPQSSFFKAYHKNWRLRAIQNIENSSPDNSIHYSSTFAISEDDGKKIWDMHLNHIQKIKKIISVSSEENIFQMNLDYYSLSKLL